ncbi:MAG: ADP-ribosylglycohydrolase family protein [Galactobacter sp.]
MTSSSQPAPSAPSDSPHLSRVLGTFSGARDAAEAESWLQLFVLDGILEAAEWAAKGVGADDVACAWLGGLRWVAALDTQVPDGAPEPPSRPFPSAVVRSVRAAGPGDPQNLIGLRSPEMSQPRRPFNRPAATVPDLAATDGTGVLARAAAIGLLAHAREEDVRRLATWSAAFSHGSPAAHAAAADAAAVLHALTHTGTLPSDAVQLLDRVLATAADGVAADAEATDTAEASNAVGHFDTAREGLTAALRAARPAVAGTFGSDDWQAVRQLAQRDGGAGAYAGALVGAVLGAQRLAEVSGRATDDVLDAATVDLAKAFTTTTLG